MLDEIMLLGRTKLRGCSPFLLGGSLPFEKEELTWLGIDREGCRGFLDISNRGVEIFKMSVDYSV